MKLSTGKVAFPIEFDNGDKQVIYFNPNDPDLMIRMRNLQERVSAKISEIEKVNDVSDENSARIAKIDMFEKIQGIVKKELDYAFGGDISETVFKYCSPFSIVGGNYFILQFVDAIVPEIEKHVKMANAAAEKRLEKHIGKYK